MAGGGSQPSQTTQTTTAEPPAYLAPYLTEAAKAAGNLYQTYEPQVWQGQDIVDYTPEEIASRQAAYTAMGPMQQMASQGAQATQFGLDPRMLTPEANPYLRQMGQAMIEPMVGSTMEALRGIQSQAIGQGAYGGSREALLGAGAISGMQKNIGNALANLYGGAYGQGLNFMGQTMGMLPQMQDAQLAQTRLRGQLGEQERTMQEAWLESQRGRFEQAQARPQQRVADYINMLAGIPGMGGGQTTVQTGAKRGRGMGSRAMGGLGGAASGAAMGSMFAPGVGTAIGALLGGLGGAFG